MEFALAWPLVLLLLLAAIQIAVYGVEAYSARAAALLGARVGSEAGGGRLPAGAAALHALGPALVGAAAAQWCPVTLGGSGGPPPRTKQTFCFFFWLRAMIAVLTCCSPAKRGLISWPCV